MFLSQITQIIHIMFFFLKTIAEIWGDAAEHIKTWK